MHKIEVTATDLGVPPLSSKRNFQIFVTDVNDNPPVCKLDNDSVQVSENFAKRARFYMVLADDKDTGQNARLTYTLLPGEGSDFFGVDTINNYQQGQVVIIKVCNSFNITLFFFSFSFSFSGIFL